MKIRLTFRVLVLILDLIGKRKIKDILKSLYSGKFVLVIDEESGDYWTEEA